MSEREVSVHEQARPEGKPAAVVRAMWCDTTERRLLRLGLASRTPFPFSSYFVSADEEQFAFIEKRSGDPFMTIATENVRSIEVGETPISYVRFSFIGHGIGLAILLDVEGPNGPVVLPLLPFSDDGRKQLMLLDNTVSLLAERLSDASGVDYPGRPKHAHRSIPDWTLDV